MVDADGSGQLPTGGAWIRHGTQTQCRTVEELAVLWPGARFSSAADEFYANALRLQFGQFRIETTLNSAYSCTRGSDEILRHPRPAVAVEVVLEGQLTRRQRGVRYLQRAGEVAVTALDEPFAFSWSGAGRSVRSVAAVSMLPPSLQQEVFPVGVLPVTALLSSFVGFMTGLVDVARPETVDQLLLEQSAIALHTSVLLETRIKPTMSRRGLRDQIGQHIDEHLSSRRLSPRSIADDLGVSVRWVHKAFNDDDSTIAAEIRRRRVLAAIAIFERGDPEDTVARVAAAVGFSGPDQLRRSFKAVHAGQSSR